MEQGVSEAEKAAIRLSGALREGWRCFWLIVGIETRHSDIFER